MHIYLTLIILTPNYINIRGLNRNYQCDTKQIQIPFRQSDGGLRFKCIQEDKFVLHKLFIFHRISGIEQM